MQLGREFFTQPTLTVAPALLGVTLVHATPTGTLRGRIMEVEAYTGADDAASHAYRGQTPRNTPMWLAGGHAYVYQIYGLHFCLNVSTDQAGQPGAVLIRSIELETPGGPRLVPGPGRVTKVLGITRAQQGLDCTTSQELFFEAAATALNRPNSLPLYHTGPRIGIRQAVDYPWRFWLD